MSSFTTFLNKEYYTW